MDGHGKAEAGFKISKHWLAMELTEWVVQDIWNQNKPNEVRAKYYLRDLIRMLRRKMVGTLSTILAAASMAKEDTRVAWPR